MVKLFLFINSKNFFEDHDKRMKKI